MLPVRPALLALAALGGPAPGFAADPAPPILGYRLEGGSPDDQRFAASALGLRGQGGFDGAALELGLASVRATDRFRSVSAQVEDLAGGRRARIGLDPWPILARWSWGGDPLPRKLRNDLLPELRRGVRPGDLRLEQWRQRAVARLREEGYPGASVELKRRADPADLEVLVALGAPSRIQAIEWDGDCAPLTRDEVLATAGIAPGASIWTAALRREAQAQLRRRFLRDRRLEWQAELTYREPGTLRIRVRPGPEVQVDFQGDRVSWTGRDQYLPILWADRFSPDLLDEGDRRLLRALQAKGFKDATVRHTREVVEGGEGAPARVKVVYTVQKGPVARIQGLRFEKNREVPSEDLLREALLPRARFGLAAPLATPDLVDAVEERVKATYFRRGFPEVSLRRRIETTGGRTELVISVREGTRRFVESITLRMPRLPAADPWRFGEALLPVLGDKPRRLQDGERGGRVFASQRSEIRGATGVLGVLPEDGDGGTRTVRLVFPRPIPLVKADLARVLGELRQRTAALGTPRPIVPLLTRTEGEAGEKVAIEIQDQPVYTVRRTVVQGSDETRADALLQDPSLGPGAPLDPLALNKAQARIGNLGAFSRVDFLSLADTPPGEGRADWRDGDVLLRLQERPHWVVSSGFGYDRLSGYHFLFGLQRLNFQGMGRTLEFNARAGDATLRNPGLRNIFTTGPFRRSLDVYTLGYSDPLFAPGKLAAWLPERTEYRATAAYLDEIQSSFEVRRRRVLNALQWKPADAIEVHLGHRFERVEVRSISSEVSDEELNKLTKTPGRVIISAPYLQYTRDRRDNPFDPTAGTFLYGRLELANQLFGTSRNASFVKLDLRHQWNWPVGYRAEYGVVTLASRIGIARPTASSSEDLPLSERFFAGGPGTHRGVEPDMLGPIGQARLLDAVTGKQLYSGGSPLFYDIPLGGQALVLANLEYRFPLFSQSVWGEVFLDSGQVYKSLRPNRDPGAPNYDDYFLYHPFHPPLRTALGVGVIFKLGIPVKIEYAMDVRRLLHRTVWTQYQYQYTDPVDGKVKLVTRDEQVAADHRTQLKNILISAGFQF